MKNVTHLENKKIETVKCKNSDLQCKTRLRCDNNGWRNYFKNVFLSGVSRESLGNIRELIFHIKKKIMSAFKRIFY